MAEFLFTDPQGQKFKVTAPEGATEAEAFSMLQGQAPQSQAIEPAPKQRTMTQELLRQLGLTGRAGLTGVTGLASAVLDTPYKLTNIGRAAFDKPPLETPSEAQQKLFTKMGLPEPEDTQENVVQILASMVAGSGDPASRALQLAAAASPAAQAYGKLPATVKAQSIKELGDAGLKIPPSVADAGIAARTVEGLGSKARTAEMMAAENRKLFDSLARKAIGLPKDAPLTPEIVKGTSDAAFEQGYKPIMELGKVGVGKGYRADLINIVKRLEGDNSFPAAQKPEVLQEVQKYLYDATGRPLQSFTGKDAVLQARQLRLDAADAFKNGKNALALAQKGIAKALEDNIARNLTARGSNGAAMLKDFTDARVLMAKAHSVEDALVLGEGSIDAVKILAQASRKKLTGELATIAKAAKVLGPAAAFSKGIPPPVNLGDSILMGGAGATAALGFPALAGVATIPLARYGLREAVMSKPFQKMLVHGTGQPPGPGIFGNPVTQRAIPSLYPLFTQGEE